MFNGIMAEMIHLREGQDPATNEIKGQQLCHLQKVKRSEVNMILRWEAGMRACTPTCAITVLNLIFKKYE